LVFGKETKEKIKLIFPKTRRQKRLEKQDEWKEKWLESGKRI
jgi:hypothetical protein